MKRLFGKLLAAVMGLGLVAGGAQAQRPAKEHAKLYVEDNAKMFGSSAIDKAKAVIADVVGDQAREVHFQTYSKLGDDQAKELKDLKDKKDTDGVRSFWRIWAKSKSVGDKGIVVLIVDSPGHVQVETPRQYQNEGFKIDHENRVAEIITNSFKAALAKKTDVEKQGERDAGLLQASKYIAEHLPVKGEKVVGNNNQVNHRPARAAGEGSGIMSWVCIGLSVMLGIWLITGLFRAFSGGGGGGGGYGPGGGGGGYGGGGGGGFMSGMLGGLFGAVAGNYLYNNMFGGSSNSYAGDNGSSSYGDNGATSTDGAGDYDGGTGGDFGGGDTGGGGGDWGGGGDTGGGGDFGGGGGDW